MSEDLISRPERLADESSYANEDRPGEQHEKPIHLLDFLPDAEARELRTALSTNPNVELVEFGPLTPLPGNFVATHRLMSVLASGHLTHAGRAFSTTTSTVTSPKGTWNTLNVTILHNGSPIGSYTRNYPISYQTFEPFVWKGKIYALYSPHYTGTRLISLPDCQDLGGEDPDGGGFCPVEYFAPHHPITGESLGFALIAGCIWGDDSSWKIQHIDLTRAHESVITRSEKFGYIELSSEMNLKQAVRLPVPNLRGSIGNYLTITHATSFDLSKS